MPRSIAWFDAVRRRAGSLALAAALTACAGNPEPGTGVGLPVVVPDAGAADTGIAQGIQCAPTNPFCTDASSAPPIEICGNEPIDLSPVGVNIMVAIDGAASMATHWPRIQEAVEGLRQSHPKAGVGMHVFWGEVVENFDQGFAKSNWCGNTKNQVLEVGDHTGAALRGFLGNAPPGPSFLGGLFETSPVIEPLNYYLKNATKLADPLRTNYLLFVTNGNDNCFGSVYATKSAKLLAYEKLAVELKKRNIRLIPIGFDAAAVPGGTGRGGTTIGRTDLDVLSTLLKHGGSGLPELPKVDDPAKLAQVIAQVGFAAKNCRFAIPTALDPAQQVNPFQLDFAINGKLVPRDRKRLDGWNFVDGNLNEVELFGSACAAIQADSKLEARKTCAKQVCGTAAVKVETRPRAVQYLLDGSASRIECIDGTLGCLIPPNSVFFMRTTMSFWEAVQHALGQSLVESINDDIEFGLQFFPSKQAATLSCDVATTPEVPPAPGTAIQMMSQMLEKLPLGFTPIVQVMEQVASGAGRLADPGVLGAVVVLSDGGDNCAGVPQEEAVARLGAAARKLREQGVKTYVVRFGSAAGKSAEQDAQLLAIVKEGGTDRSDPADPSRTPYVDAKSDAELSAALSEISDTLATCAFGLGELPANADKANANLYLNGEVIPFDSTQSQSNGWSWADAEKTSVQLYGESCKAFKTQRKTSVVVEFGCAPVVLF